MYRISRPFLSQYLGIGPELPGQRRRFPVGALIGAGAAWDEMKFKVIVVVRTRMEVVETMLCNEVRRCGSQLFNLRT